MNEEGSTVAGRVMLLVSVTPMQVLLLLSYGLFPAEGAGLGLYWYGKALLVDVLVTTSRLL